MPGEKPLTEIDAELYEVLADKALSFGCKIKCKASDGYKDVLGVYTILRGRYEEEDIENYDLLESQHGGVFRHDFVKIIGHEPTLNDVVAAFARKWGWSEKIGVVTLAGRLENYQQYCKSVEERNEMIHGLFVLENINTNFDNWSDQTKRKLWELICKK